MLRIFCDKKEKDLKNFWNHIVFHPTDAIEDDWGKRILDKCAEDKAVKTVRIYTMMEDIFTLDENGEMHADYTLNDYRIDYLLSKGFTPFLAYAFLPAWLCENTELRSSVAKSKLRYKGKIVYNTRATDYSKWEEICRQYTQHIVDRYGEETVAKWRIHCYNEPDLPGFFYMDAPSNEARCAEYCKMYDAFERGILSVSDKLFFGGPALAQSNGNFEFLRLFLDYVKKNNRRIDFISIHSYGTHPSCMNKETKPLGISGALKNTMTLVNIAKMCGFGDKPIYCDEWGAATCGFYNMEECPPFIFRENELYSAYFAKMLIHFDEINIPCEEMMLCLSGQHEMKTDFSGFRNFFTLNFYPKPIYNAYVLAGKLGSEKLFHISDLTSGNITDEHFSVMPTKHSDGHISTLICYADGEFRINLPAAETEVKFENIDKAYNVIRYVIDKNNANAITKYNELGCPDNPTDAQKKEISDFASLMPENIGKVSPENNSVSFTMEQNAVVLLELFPLV